MGIKERRDVEKAEMKNMIMNAAIEIIGQEGYEKLSIRKIAAKIEYSPTTIYIYYKDKAEIIRDMCDGLYSKVMRDIAAKINAAAMMPPDEKMREVLRIFIKGLCSEPEMVKAVMYSGVNVIFADDGSTGTPANPGIKLLDGLISDGIAKNIFKPNTEGASWMIVSALLGFILSCIANQLHLDDTFGPFADDFIEILMGGAEL